MSKRRWEDYEIGEEYSGVGTVLTKGTCGGWHYIGTVHIGRHSDGVHPCQ